MTTAGREMKIRQLSVSRPTCTYMLYACCMHAGSIGRAHRLPIPDPALALSPTPTPSLSLSPTPTQTPTPTPSLSPRLSPSLD